MNLIEKIYSQKSGVILIIIFCCIAIYGKTISYNYSLDDHLINKNLSSKKEDINGIFSVFKERFAGNDYRPVLLLSYELENYVFGNSNPNISHLINVLLYILVCIGIYLLILQLPIQKNKKEIAFWITLLFVTHPIHANVVGNLKSRDNLLSMLFSLLSSILIFKSLSKKNKYSILYFITGALFFVPAILSKRDALGFIVFVPLVIMLFYNPKYLIAPVIVIVIYFFLYDWFYQILPEKIATNNENYIIKTTFTENPFVNDFTLVNKLGATAMTGFYYLKMLVIPCGYWYYFGYDQVKLFPINSLPAIASFVMILIITGIGILNFKKDKLLTLGIFSIFIFLIYCLNFFIPVAGIIADRYAFMSSLGFCIIVVSLINRFTKYNMILAWKICLVICLIWSIFSFIRVGVWKDGVTLIENDIPHLEKSYEAQRIAAMTYVEQYEKNQDKKLLDKALFHIKKANSIYPNNSVCQVFEGIINYKKGNLKNAELQFSIAFKNDSASYEALELLADLKYELKDLIAARKAYDVLYKIKPEKNSVVNKISTIIYESGNIDSVLKYNNALMETDTLLFAPYENLGYLFLLQKDTVAAKLYFDSAIKNGMDPYGIPSEIR